MQNTMQLSIEDTNQAGTPILFFGGVGGGQPHTPFFLQHTDPLIQHIPTPVAIVWNKLIIHHPARATITPGSFRVHREEEGLRHNSGNSTSLD